MNLTELPKEEYFIHGHRACAGCAAPIALRLILKVLGPRTIIVNATSCMEIVSTPYPDNAWMVPYIHSLFENTAAVASGIEAALKIQMKKGRRAKERINVVVIAGDGGTADIGLQALSGALERGHDFLYICYDNEAYMNTGIQRSSSTPYGAWTTTSPPGRISIGQDTWKKDVAKIAAAHDIPYAATASIGYPQDLINKIEKASKIIGPKYIQIHSPCPTGWRYDTSLTIEIARLAVQSGMWILAEYENGEFKPRKIAKKVPVKEYLRLQGRFRHLPDEEIEKIQKHIDERLAKLGI
ncbi:MAG: pyruvate synthase subunit PorB [Methanocellales archaeon]